MALTTAEIKAMRNAEHVVFHHEHRPGEHLAKDYAIARKEHDPGDGFGRRELEVRIPIAGSRFEAYSLDGDGDIVWASGVGRKYSPEWATVLGLLRVGDELIARWVLGNNSDTLKAAGLSHDEFKLTIVRTTKTGSRQMTFWLDDIITPEHSSARMATRSTRVFS